MENQNNNVLIDRYLSGQMSEEETRNFEMRLEKEPKLLEELEEYRKVVQIIETGALSERLEGIYVKHKLKQQNHKKFYLLTAMVVAASMVVVLSFWFLYQPTAATPYQQLIASMYYKDPGLPTLMSSGSGEKSMEMAMIEYKQGNFEQSFSILNDMHAEQPQNDTLQLYLGINQFEMENYSRSIVFFERLLGSGSVYIREKAEWFLTLNYLQLENKADARKMLFSIASDNDHFYQGEAENALLMMEMIFGLEETGTE